MLAFLVVFLVGPVAGFLLAFLLVFLAAVWVKFCSRIRLTSRGPSAVVAEAAENDLLDRSVALGIVSTQGRPPIRRQGRELAQPGTGPRPSRSTRARHCGRKTG